VVLYILASADDTCALRGDISAAEKKAYIAAMLCIMQKPSKLDPAKFPGAKSRYDDFVVVHMNQTLNIHGTVRPCRLHLQDATEDLQPPREASSRGTATTPGRLSESFSRNVGITGLSL
jgi:hypothetical protein